MDSRPQRADRLSVLFTDISGSTELYADRGDTVGFALADACLRLMEEHVAAAKGRVVKRVGDGVMAVFDSGAAALAAAVAIQQAVEADAHLRAERVHVRTGISTGPVVLLGEDVYGDVVNVAARLLSYAGPDEIFLAEGTFEELPVALSDAARLVDQVVLRGRPESMRVYEFGWKQDDATISVRRRTRAPQRTMGVDFRQRQFSVTAKHPRLRIGRAADNDIVVEHDLVSRYHAELRLRGDKFELVDQSTNGTFLTEADGRVSRVARENVTLGTEGSIRLGSESAEPITFRVNEEPKG